MNAYHLGRQVEMSFAVDGSGFDMIVIDGTHRCGWNRPLDTEG
jgi:hypothetical protein